MWHVQDGWGQYHTPGGLLGSSSSDESSLVRGGAVWTEEEVDL